MAPLPALLLGALLAPAARAGDVPREIERRIIDLRRELHRHPELPNRETRTMRRVERYARELGLSDVRAGAAKTGVLATLRGARPGPTVAIRAPMDAFPLEEKAGRPHRSRVPGVSHACGHDAMTAMALGAAELLFREREALRGSVLFVFQPAEEGPPEGEEGGAPLLIKEGALKGVSAVIGFHVETEIPVGEFGLRPEAVHAGADDIRVTVLGRAAHGAMPWKGVDALAVAGQILQGLQLVSSRQADIWDPVVLSFGTARAGVGPNALADKAELTGTLRSFSPEARARARASIERVVLRTAEAFGAKAELAVYNSIPPSRNAPELVAALRPVLEEAGGVRVLRPASYADDYSVLVEEIPGFFFDIGVRNESKGIVAGTHTAEFDLDEEAIPLGARTLAELAKRLLR